VSVELPKPNVNLQYFSGHISSQKYPNLSDIVLVAGLMFVIQVLRSSEAELQKLKKSEAEL
jgi:hypothetical protein